MKINQPQRLDDFIETPINMSESLFILIIESKKYTEKVLERFPQAKIFYVTRDVYELEEAKEKLSSRVYYVPVSYNEAKLPFKVRTFDVILGDNLLAENFNPQDIASGLCSFLKSTGYLLTTFSNLLYKPYIDKLLKDERSEFIVRRGFTGEDFERLLTASFFKEVFFYPLFEKDEGENFEKNLKERARKEEPPFYAVKAYASVTPVRALKSLYTEKIRKEFATLLHRIEYGVNREESLEKLKKFMSDNYIFEDYLFDFVKETCFTPKKVMRFLNLGNF